MIVDIGLIALVLAFASAAYAVGAAAYGGATKRPTWVASARYAALTIAPLLTIACLMVILSNLTDNYNLAYTYRVSNRAQLTVLKITSLWGGQNGSVLFFAWLMSLFVFALFVKEWRGNRDLEPWVIVVSMGTQLFFLFLSLFFANPFERLWLGADGEVGAAVIAPAGARSFTPADGQGLNPLLRHWGMIIHPPLLYLGFVGLTIPYAFGMAALLGGSTASDAAWIKATRRWTLLAWLFLSLGLLLGGRWAYDVLGWGGYWGWDPVENSALLPWLTATAFVHSVMIQEKRGMFKIWNMILIVMTFCLMILGTFMTRTGVISSVHSFARSSLGYPFLAFTGLVLISSAALVIWRWNYLKSENRLESLWSREFAFVLNNFLFLTITFTVFLGTYYSMFSELIIGEKLTVGPAVFNALIGPQVTALVLLMGVGPLLAWRKSSPQALVRMTWQAALVALVVVAVLFVLGFRSLGALAGFGVIAYAGLVTLEELYRGVRARMKLSAESPLTALGRLIARNRRRYGGYVIHIGIILMGIGVIGTMMYQQETERGLRPGESVTIGDYTIIYQGSEMYVPEKEPDITVFVGNVLLSVAGGPLEVMDPRPYREIFQQGGGLLPPALRSTLAEDLYVLFMGEEGGFGTLKVFVNPLVNWIWIGGLVLIVGTLAAMWPSGAAATVAVKSRSRSLVVGEAGR
ncbi:MAG TPA: cytochrome c-type biogenesis CcmF C-terminal domain-containing protein [Anaerolineae bacterium]|nr:cytochrome c-type biogenesis CcmF C-terminal domain-containing protein [Anaerolineae bacterium]